MAANIDVQCRLLTSQADANTATAAAEWHIPLRPIAACSCLKTNTLSTAYSIAYVNYEFDAPVKQMTWHSKQ